MQRAHSDVSAHLPMTLVADHALAGGPVTAVESTPSVGDATVDVVATYRAGDPFALTLRFLTPDGHVDWVVSRDVLTHGLGAAAGYGDVLVWPASEESTAVVLSSPSGRATLLCDTDTLRAFVDATYVTVPAGTEGAHLDIDGLVDLLLADDLV